MEEESHDDDDNDVGLTKAVVVVAPDIGIAAELTITNSNNNKKIIVETIMDNGKYRLLFFMLVTSAIVNIYFVRSSWLGSSAVSQYST